MQSITLHQNPTVTRAYKLVSETYNIVTKQSHKKAPKKKMHS